MKYLGTEKYYESGRNFVEWKNNKYYLIESEEEITEAVKNCFGCSYHYLYTEEEWIRKLKSAFREGKIIIVADKDEGKIYNGEEWRNVKRGPMIVDKDKFEKLLKGLK